MGELRFAIMASGRGSNAMALLDAFDSGFIPAQLVLVVSNRAGAPVLQKAAARRVPTQVVPDLGLSRAEHEKQLLAALAAAQVDHLLLAGYMKILSPTFLRGFGGAILNIHPALLPEFPGLHAAQKQWQAGVKVAGATVHLVDEGVDSGPILLQGSLEVRGDEGAEGLAERIRTEVEHVIYPRAVRLFIDRLGRGGKKPHAASQGDAAPGLLRRALISVHDKTGLLPFGRALHAQGVEILASGGSARVLQSAGVPVTPVESFTGAAEVLDGRVKTLHPKIHAGILADRRNPAHLHELDDEGYLPIDLVVCNLYPFEKTLASGAARADIIENIDIGGPTLVRAAAKNAEGGVAVVVDPADYDKVLAAVPSGQLEIALRQELASKAFTLIAAYDAAIAAWYAGDALPFGERLPGFVRRQGLRYGENPHQKGFLYLAEGETSGVARGVLLHGKELSYNNYLDIDGAYRTAQQLTRFGCAIIKHTNPCGLAEASTQREAFARALAGDPVSAFGSVLGFNAPVSGDTAATLRDAKLFVECIVAPGFAEEALAILRQREALRLLQAPPGNPNPSWHGHRIGGGMLVQEVDQGLADPASWRVVTKRQPEAGWLDELAFAMRAAAVLKSNAIAITRDRMLLGAGTGQMSRVDATEHAIKKAGDKCRGAFLGSDAFFPFADAVRLAGKAGLVAIAQPGGSKRDQEVIAACDELGVCMLFTGRRHFRH